MPRKRRIPSGEKSIRNYLRINNILHELEKTFPLCRHKALLRFDFYLPLYNLCLEFDGIQHFKSVRKFGGKKGLLACNERDSIKFNFCKKYEISLLRIPYHKLLKIPQLLNGFLRWLTKYPNYFILVDTRLPYFYNKKSMNLPNFF